MRVKNDYKSTIFAAKSGESALYRAAAGSVPVHRERPHQYSSEHVDWLCDCTRHMTPGSRTTTPAQIASSRATTSVVWLGGQCRSSVAARLLR